MNEPTVSAVEHVAKQPVVVEPECCDVYGEYCYPCAEGESDPREHIDDELGQH